MRPARSSGGLRRSGLFSLPALLALPLALSGCASLSEAECRVGNWYAIGQGDGYSGRPTARLADHVSACVDYGITPDGATYAAGREAGLQQYCQPARGYREGLAGNGYAGVCPINSEPGFLEGYEAGREVARVANRIDDIEDRIDRLRYGLRDNASDQNAALDALEDGDDDARDRLRALDRAEWRIRDEIDDLREERFRLRRIEHDLRQRYAQRFGVYR